MKDESWVRGNIPMTKREVRAVSLDYLELEPDSVLYDIGAGTGSVSVEAAMQMPYGHVYAFEQKEEGCRLIEENGRRMGVSNLTVVKGKAPESLESFPPPDRVFLGGSGGKLMEILDTVFRKNPRALVVINVIALETLQTAVAYIEEHGLEAEISCVQASRARKRGRYHMMEGQNPVYVIAVRGTGESPECGGVSLPRLMVSAPASGSGKTVLTAALLAALKNRGVRCVSCKCGPDYIDPMFHRYVLGVCGCTLDSFFLPEEQVRAQLVRHGQGAMAVIEGAMGYYDGIGGTDWHGSSYDIARITKTPVVLVLDGKKSSLSLAAQLKGFLTYRSDSRIVGVIVNRTSPMMGSRLAPIFEAFGVRFLGAVPDCEEAKLESRHLGLTMPAEQKALGERIEALAKKLEEWLDIDALLALANAAPALEAVRETPSPVPSRCRRMAVARDEAFCFYYQENLDFLQEEGWELVEFSPLHDLKLPEHIDGLLLGGGYPELYARELSENQSMLASVRAAVREGKKLLAECGGFLYLHRTLEGADKNRYPMAGVIEADAFRTDRLSRFGYVTLSGAGEIKGHEFHYWDSTAPGSDLYAKKPGSSRGWPCMYLTRQMAVGFPHLYYRSAPEWVRALLEEEKP